MFSVLLDGILTKVTVKVSENQSKRPENCISNKTSDCTVDPQRTRAVCPVGFGKKSVSTEEKLDERVPATAGVCPVGFGKKSVSIEKKTDEHVTAGICPVGFGKKAPADTANLAEPPDTPEHPLAKFACAKKVAWVHAVFVILLCILVCSYIFLFFKKN